MFARPFPILVPVVHGMLCLALLLASQHSLGADRTPGYRQTAYAITNVTAVVGPKETIQPATIVLRNGVIQAVGPEGQVEIPFDAERIDGQGLHAYAGFIDAFSTSGIDENAQRSRTGTGQKVDYGSFALGSTPPDNRRGLTPEFQVSDAVDLEDKAVSPRRSAGFTCGLIAPGGGLATGQSALVSFNGRPRREIIIESPIALHVALNSPGRQRSYPITLMGYVAHLRQSMIDARHYDDLWSHYREYGGQRPPVDPTLATLRLAQTGELRVFWQANERDEIHRALDLADEFGITPVIVGGREAWRVAERLAAAQVPVVLRIDFPDEPTSGSAGGQRRGRAASMTPAQMREMLQRTDLPDQLRQRLQERLQAAEGSARPSTRGKKVTKQLPESPRLLSERKRQWRERIQGAAQLAKQGVLFCFSAEGHKKPSEFKGHLAKCIELGLSPQQALAGLTTDAAKILGISGRIGTLAQGNAAHLVVFDGPFHAADAKLRYAFIDQDKFELSESEAVDDESSEATDESEEQEQAEPVDSEAESPADPDKADEQPELQQESPPGSQRGPVAQANPREPFPTEIEEDRQPSFRTNGNLAIRNATILTVTQGTIPRGTIVVQDGKITAVGQDIDVPQECHVVQAEGLYVMPGMVDTHSHIAISNGTNESSLAVVPEVRVRDVVSGASSSIYRALAGGLTTARLLHGSSNPIGGQDGVIKLRWGKPGRELIIRSAPRGVKFALGENPKRSSSRYPDTRLGVEAVIRRSFEEGRMYRRLWQLYADARSRGENIPEPRRDLRLEALADIVEGKLEIHCHCYRADEILMLLRLAESYGIRIKSLQHVLEGYKVAAEIAAHGASNATFSDWWAYKVEAYDAIPHNAALLVQAGAKVTLKSDSSELMRHMNQEGAKTMRYGGLNENQALRLVTINAAEQIDLDHRLGSIEIGKDADLAVFNGHPLNGFSRCEMTFVDGEIYFERRGEHRPSPHSVPLPHRSAPVAIQFPPPHGSTYALVNARIVPVVGPTIPRGTLVVKGQLIESIQEGDAPVPRDAVTIDLKGLAVFPGMINAGGTLGLTEISSLRETQDYSERGRYNSDIRASVALHPDSEIIPVTRANGVLSSLTRPSGGVICGQSVLINLDGWIPPEMAVVDPLALHINFPRGAYGEGDTRRRAETQIAELKQRFQLALRYAELQQRQPQDPAALTKSDPKLEALAPYAQGQRMVIIDANNHGDILAAIEFADQLKLKWVLSGAAEAWKCVNDLKKHEVAVILGPSLSLPRASAAPYDVVYRTAAMLHEAGIRFCIQSKDGATDHRNLPFHAAMSVAYGLPVAAGLKAVTWQAAQILGVDDRLGSLEPGKLANLVICDGHLLQPATQVKGIFIGGKPLAPTSRHTRLFARYQQRLRQVRSGKAPLGVSTPLPSQLAEQPDEQPPTKTQQPTKPVESSAGDAQQ